MTSVWVCHQWPFVLIIAQPTFLVQLSNQNLYFYRFRCHHLLITQLTLDQQCPKSIWTYRLSRQQTTKQVSVLPSSFRTELSTLVHCEGVPLRPRQMALVSWVLGVLKKFAAMKVISRRMRHLHRNQ